MKNSRIGDKDIPAIICFAGCDWWYHNRGLFCSQVMKKLAKNHKVLFVNSLGMRIPSLKSDPHAISKIGRKLRSTIRFLRKTEKGMYVLSVISLPFGNRLGRKLNSYSVFLQVKLVSVLLGITKPIIFIGCPPALEVAKKLGARYLVYQRTDLFEEMPGTNKSYITLLDDELTRSANLVLYVNRALYEQGISKNKNSLLLGHGVDFDFFLGAAQSDHIPHDVAKISRPIIGFFGDVTEEACDFALLEHLAKTLSDMSLVLVGPASSDVSVLRAYDNIFFLGQKPYEQIPHYGKMFDVAIMPWKKNRWIEFCNPVKIKEYLALGKPVVSTYYPEIESYRDVVYVAGDYDGFVSCIREAVEENDPAKVQERRKRVKNETWDSKVEQIREFVNGHLFGGTSASCCSARERESTDEP